MCYRPRYITVKGEEIAVPCGKCQDCLNKKADRNGLLCKLEASHHKYNHFVTLTYDMASVPTARFEYYTTHNNTKYHIRAVNVSERMKSDYEDTDGVIFASYDIPKYDFQLTLQTFYENRYEYFKPYEFPYTTGKEASRFIKRLRYYIAEYFDFEYKPESQIRYFIASEYGPQTFRPHFHCIIHHDSDDLQKALSDLVCKAWTFGNTTTELACGGCANYSASYTAANSLVPFLHRQRSIRPKFLHSKGYGYEKASIVKQGVSALHFAGLNRRYFQDGSILKRISPTLSLQSSLFPKCVSFGTLTHTERLNCFCFLLSAKRIYGNGFTLKEYARFFYEDRGKFSFTEDYHLSFFQKIYSESLKTNDYEQMLYSILCRSSQFLFLCRLFGVSPEYYLSSIELYYIHREKYVLNEWYKQREATPLSDPMQIVFDYDNLSPEMASFKELSDSLSKNPLTLYGWWFNNREDPKVNKSLAECWSKASIKANKRLKHKELQDRNQIFNYKEKWQM